MAPLTANICILVVLICTLVPESTSFTANLPYHQPSRAATTGTSTVVSRMVPLSNEEIFARAAQQKAQVELEAAPPPSLAPTAKYPASPIHGA